MFKPKRQTVRNFVIVSILILIAIACRIITKIGIVDGLFNMVLVFIRAFIYIGLISFWVVSVNKRVLQSSVRRSLVTEALLMLILLILKEMKYRFVVSELLTRYLWYAYYIPLLLIPLIGLFISFYLGKGEDYRLPPGAIFMSVPNLFFIISVLTNDFHQLVFVFNGSSWTEKTYSYGPFYYAMIAWIFVCMVVSVVILVKKSRIAKIRKRIWLPITILAVMIVYLVLYAVKVPVTRGFLGDLPVIITMLTLAFFEFCIQCGLIQSNSGYYDFFRASVGTSLQIVDNNYRMRITSINTQPISKKDMMAAENNPIIFPDGKRLHNMSIKGGHAIWIENMSELVKLKEILQDYQEELKDRNALLQYEYEREKEYRPVEEQNRLYDLLQSKIQKQLDKIETLVHRYGDTEDENEKKKILANILVLGSYIKRKEDLVLSIDSSSSVPEAKLSNAFDESFRSLRRLDIKGGYVVETGKNEIPGAVVSKAYDFFEDFIEMVLNDVRFVNVSISSSNNKIREVIRTDIYTDWNQLKKEYPDMNIIKEDDGTVLVLVLEGGESL